LEYVKAQKFFFVGTPFWSDDNSLTDKSTNRGIKVQGGRKRKRNHHHHEHFEHNDDEGELEGGI
jgi:hypothetical protein